LVRERLTEPITVTQWSANIAQQLLARYAIVLRETIAENVPRGDALIESRKQNPDARTTFWCPQCQSMAR
jgi:hypothetical protein